MSKRVVKALAVLLCAALTLCGCGGTDANEKKEQTLFAMDTVMQFDAYGPQAEKALDTAQQTIAHCEQLLSVTVQDSDVARINAGSGAPVEVSAETLALVRRAVEIGELTSGAFDITVYPVVAEWGFFTDDPRVPEPEAIAGLMQYVDYSQVTFGENSVELPARCAVDLGGIAKGYAAQCIIDEWRGLGLTSGLLSLGGNVQLLGSKPDGTDWSVAIRDPNTEGYAGVLAASDVAIVTSGGYERNFTQDGVLYHHIIDPSTGYPANNGLVSVTVVSSDGTLADGLSTGLFVMGEEGALELWRSRGDIELILITSDGRMLVTEGIFDDFTPEKSAGYSLQKVAR